MSDALEEHDGKVSIGGRNITNLRFADDIDALAEEEQELEALVESLDKTCTRYKMEISAEKTKLMTNSANGIQREIKVKGQKLGTVTSFKYLGAIVSDDGSKPEVLSRIAQATAALTKLKPIWRDNNISLGSKVKLMRSLVISIFLYACESWYPDKTPPAHFGIGGRNPPQVFYRVDITPPATFDRVDKTPLVSFARWIKSPYHVDKTPLGQNPPDARLGTSPVVEGCSCYTHKPGM